MFDDLHSVPKKPCSVCVYAQKEKRKKIQLRLVEITMPARKEKKRREKSSLALARLVSLPRILAPFEYLDPIEKYTLILPH